MIAIDPGASGGFAWLDQDGHPQCCAMPKTEGDVLELICELRCQPQFAATVEQVSGFCGNGQPGSAMFKFGRGFGFLLGCLMAHDFCVHLVQPRAWQKPLGLGTAASCETKNEWKNKLKAEAQRRYPSCHVTLATADALLILDYAVQQRLARTTLHTPAPAP